MPPIPESSEAPEPELPGTTIVPKEAAEFPKEQEDVEAIPFKISFEDYKNRECQIDGLKKTNAAAVLKIIRDIGVYFTDESNLLANASCIDEILTIVRRGDYLQICKGLEEDIQVKEIKYAHQNRRQPENDVDIRLFFYTLESERTFYVLAVRQDHYNLDHS